MEKNLFYKNFFKKNSFDGKTFLMENSFNRKNIFIIKTCSHAQYICIFTFAQLISKYFYKLCHESCQPLNSIQLFRAYSDSHISES